MAVSSMLSLDRWRGRLQRANARYCGRRPFTMRNRAPMISFTFDDFPHSALHTAGRILQDNGIAGTYYVSLGLMGTTAPTGEMFTEEDLPQLLERGHELGCHTHAHCHAAETPVDPFEQSILDNRAALQRLLPGASAFRTLSYPIGSPRPETKRRCERHFAGCRAGGQAHNAGTIDLNLLQAFFLEQSRDNSNAIKAAIDECCDTNGWLIFATHDVADAPTRYGVTPTLFRDVVRHCIASSARLVTVTDALHGLGVTAEVSSP